MDRYMRSECKQKSLVMFHLESVSNYILATNKDCFPNLLSLSSNMLSYRNYYSSATSTYMVIADLFFGGDSCFEKSEYLENIFGITPKTHSLWMKLEQAGYRTACFMHGYEQKFHEEGRKLGNLLSPNAVTWVGDDMEAFSKTLSSIVEKKDKPFAIFIDDNAGHISYDGERICKKNCVGEEWYISRYHAIDNSIGNVISILKQYNCIDEVMFVFYGDHGEEYWFHGMYDGYTHAIEPFLSLTHCPLFIGTTQTKAKSTDRLLSTYLLADEILFYLGLADRRDDCKYIYFRNLFASQKRMANVFNKSYGITDGKYTLIVTKSGLRMYVNRIDPMCNLNILDFFKKQKGQLVFDKMYLINRSTHFARFFSEEEIQNILVHYYSLHSQLKKHLDRIGPIQTKLGINRIYRKGRKRVKMSCNGMVLLVWKKVRNVKSVYNAVRLFRKNKQ